MALKALIRHALNRFLNRYGYRIAIANPPPNPAVYDQDDLRTVHNHDFMQDPSFIRAYARGVHAGEGVDNKMHWRIHVALWVAHQATKLPGDFVECGVNKGVVSSSVMEYLDWNRLGKRFFLLDTFGGMDERVITDEERRLGKLELNQEVLDANGWELNVDSVIANFSEWERVHVIKGTVPETLPRVDATEVAYLHLDMNCSVPEQAAAEFFWPRLVPGGFILLDDYAYFGYETQKRALDRFAQARGVTVLSLPTGQGLIGKPVHSQAPAAHSAENRSHHLAARG